MKIKLLSLILLCACSLTSLAQTTVIDSILSGGIYRNYRIYIPAVYTGTTARPLVFDLHGYTSSASAEQAYSNFMPIADTANIIMVYPNGTLSGGQPYWNAGFGGAVNDIGFISDLIDTLLTQYNIDPDMVYSCGMSNGGYMSHTLACELNTRIAAIASVTGSMSSYQQSICTPNRPVPVMQISGDADGTVAYTGSAGSMGIDALVSYWVSNNNCNASAVFSNVPNTSTSDGCTAEHYLYNGGDMGSTVEKYKIIGGGHTWPGSPYTIGVTNQDFKASEKIWLFFRKYKLNQFVGLNEMQNDGKLIIFPNPATNLINIEGAAIAWITILDMQGKVVMQTQQKQMDVSSLAKGVYSIVILSENNRSVRKLVKL
ncbi:MAG TPA: T9SS type A sorting domain-containing protein [Bacteroidia bacterium]|jgi:polyhydroxybutyrate depolymerase